MEDFKNIEDLKLGDYFKRKETSKLIFQRGKYNRSTKRYENPCFDDINHFCDLAKNKEVFVNFDF